MKKQYGWKNGARFDVDPQPVGEALARLNGPTAEQIVEAAKDAGSPLHGLFNWDIKSAAHEHWLATAQLIGRNITVTMTGENHAPTIVRAFEAVDTGEDGGKCYVPVETVLSTEEYCGQVMSRIRGDLISTQRELDTYSYLSGQMEKASKKVGQAVRALT